MGDVFLEERVRQQPQPAKRLLVVAGCALLALLAFPVLLKMGGVVVATIGLVAVGLLTRSLLRRQSKEFEYTFTNGSLDIDVIYNKEWRRRLYSLELREDVEAMAPAAGQHLRSARERAAEMRNVGSGCPDQDSYFLLLNAREGKQRSLLVWDPSTKMVQACRNWAPRTVVVGSRDGADA